MLGVSIIFLSWFAIFSQAGSKELIISVAEIPELAYTNDAGEFVGPFVELAKMIGKTYTELYNGKFSIIHRSFAGSIYNVTNGDADAHLPVFRNNDIPESIYKFRMADEPMGKLFANLYTLKDSKINKAMIDEMLNKKDFSLKIEGARGMEFCYYFPVLSTHDIRGSLLKIQLGRIDGLAWAQDEVNALIRENNWGSLFKFELLGEWDDAIVIKSGKPGDWANVVISKCLRKLKESKDFQELYNKIHKPYDRNPF